MIACRLRAGVRACAPGSRASAMRARRRPRRSRSSSARRSRSNRKSSARRGASTCTCRRATPESDLRVPVLYMPDGGIAEDFLHVAGLVQVSVGNGTMRPFLLVGIENTERRRDMTGPTDNAEDKKIAPRVGGSRDISQVHPRRADAAGEAALPHDGRNARSSANRWPGSSSSRRFSSSPIFSTPTSRSIRACGGTITSSSTARPLRCMRGRGSPRRCILRAAASSAATSMRRRASPKSCAPMRRPACAGITRRCRKRSTRRSTIRRR